jgi:hypothetical protein
MMERKSVRPGAPLEGDYLPFDPAARDLRGFSVSSGSWWLAFGATGSNRAG